ncbi:MAG: helix-turn-helix domain-containing protein [Sideroxydans sp.]|nr:helix-turn-helix domain-containing protein [Sideroxydans sp.]
MWGNMAAIRYWHFSRHIPDNTSAWTREVSASFPECVKMGRGVGQTGDCVVAACRIAAADRRAGPRLGMWIVSHGMAWQINTCLYCKHRPILNLGKTGRLSVYLISVGLVSYLNRCLGVDHGSDMDTVTLRQPGEPVGDSVDAATAWHFHEVVDAAQLADLQSWVSTIKTRQLSAGQCNGRFGEISLGGLRIVSESHNCTINKNGILPDDVCTVSTASTALRFSQFDDKQASSVFFLPGGAEFDIHVPENVETLYVAFDQRELLAGARVLDEASWERQPTDLLVFDSPGRRHFDMLLHSLFELIPKRIAEGIEPDGDFIRRTINDTVLLVMSGATTVCAGDSPEYRSHRRALRLVNAARDYIDACLQAGHCPSIVDICRAVGIGQRALQSSFDLLLQLSPVAYLRIARLNLVRAELRAPSSPHLTVTEAATHWGFLHLGRFAADYGAMFGEKPSETLRRALA